MELSVDTELDAVNTIIEAIGESPVNSLESATNVSVLNAMRILARINRQEQSKGWGFNEVPEYVLNPNEDTHKIDWASDFLKIVGTDHTRYVKRNGYLYDFTNQTATFTKSLTVKAILLTPFVEMPEAMRNYITAKAARKFGQEFLGDAEVVEGLLRDEQEAYAALNTSELEDNGLNMLDNPEVAAMVSR